MKDQSPSGKVELPHPNLTRGHQILLKKENTAGHGVSAFSGKTLRNTALAVPAGNAAQASHTYLLPGGSEIFLLLSPLLLYS